MTRNHPNTVLPLTIGGLIHAGALVAQAGQENQQSSKGGSTSVELAFKTHLDTSLPEQEVFIKREPGAAALGQSAPEPHGPEPATSTEQVPHRLRSGLPVTE